MIKQDGSQRWAVLFLRFGALSQDLDVSVAQLTLRWFFGGRL
ncbi:hypothetical protein ACFFGS_05660 [Lactiplantibacillus plajomi]|uniref:Uncharacterized protein n=1 Tax=Lactiplantibacillus plajomi TaxID=1457217 RepID=A0ABV6K2C3_9LACO